MIDASGDGIPDIVQPSVEFPGLALTAAGVGFCIWARAYPGGHWSGSVTVKVDHQLVRTGPYRLVRHPIYTGFLLGLVGTALVRGEVRGFFGRGRPLHRPEDEEQNRRTGHDRRLRPGVRRLPPDNRRKSSLLDVLNAAPVGLPQVDPGRKPRALERGAGDGPPEYSRGNRLYTR
jgi:hypothetical protein